MIGVLGGGQLGTFFTIAAKQLGYRVSVWDPDPEAPAHAWADLSIPSDFKDTQSLQVFIKENKAATYEWENIPLELVKAIESECPVHPGSAVLSRLQNRLSEKEFLSKHRFPHTSYLPILKKEALASAGMELGFPFICKTSTAGYDGIGQWFLKNEEDVGELIAGLKPRKTGWIAEKVVPFIKELSILVARNEQGDVVTYPITENKHEAGILRYCNVPANVPLSVSQRASALASAVLKALDGIGLFCIELFLLEDECFLINEIAPRPHNSGHLTLDVASTSQYEQQVRAVCGLPLENPALLSPALMVNLLGDDIKVLKKEGLLKKLLSLPGIKIYDYRKQEITPRRKMGHITVTGSDPQQLSERAKAVRLILNQAKK